MLSDYGFKATFGNQTDTLFLKRSLQAILYSSVSIDNVEFTRNEIQQEPERLPVLIEWSDSASLAKSEWESPDFSGGELSYFRREVYCIEYKLGIDRVDKYIDVENAVQDTHGIDEYWV